MGSYSINSDKWRERNQYIYFDKLNDIRLYILMLYNYKFVTVSKTGDKLPVTFNTI